MYRVYRAWGVCVEGGGDLCFYHDTEKIGGCLRSVSSVSTVHVKAENPTLLIRLAGFFLAPASDEGPASEGYEASGSSSSSTGVHELQVDEERGVGVSGANARGTKGATQVVS